MSIQRFRGYEWDPAKARANVVTHGVDFVEAASALEDSNGLTREDPDATDEQRFATLGMTAFGRLVVVVWTERDRRVRIISAWRATARQRMHYAQNTS